MGFEDIMNLTSPTQGGGSQSSTPMAQFATANMPVVKVSETINPAAPPERQTMASNSLFDQAKDVLTRFAFGQNALKQAAGQGQPPAAQPPTQFAPGQYEGLVRQYQADADRARQKRPTQPSPKQQATPKPAQGSGTGEGK